MEDLYRLLMRDVRFEEGLNACMNCGVCTAICPAAEYYSYDPRRVVDIVGGEIAVKSTLGKGSTFSVVLRAETNETP